MNKKKCLIVGYGTVGCNLYTELFKLSCDVCDKYKNIDDILDREYPKDFEYDIAFICVDTPLSNEVMYKSLDSKEVLNAINENNAKIYVIKSTVPVGCTDSLKKLTGKRIIFSPEYYGGTQHCNNYKFDFTILGGDKEDCKEVIQVLQNVYDGRHKFIMTDSKTAEMAKFMENAWIAMKVSFCNDFYTACQKSDISYEELRELFILDPRVNPSHTFVYADHPYWDSHCLNKDVPSIAYQFDMPLLKSMIDINNNRK